MGRLIDADKLLEETRRDRDYARKNGFLDMYLVTGQYKPPKTYRQDIQAGKLSLARELSSIAEKHLKIEIREDKKNNKVSQRQFEKFKELMNEDSYKESDTQ